MTYRKIFSAVVAFTAAAAIGFAQEKDEAAATAQDVENTSEEPAPEAKPKYWDNGIQIDLGANQTGLWNWAAGGSNSISLAAGIDAHANYAKDLISWNNRLQLNYGFMWVKDNQFPWQKNSDRIYLESIWGRDMSEKSKWKYSAAFDFRSQFTKGFDYGTVIDGNPKYLSNFMAPAYINLALGFEWKPRDWFSLNLAPVTGGVVVCTDEDLRASYGMKPYNPENPNDGYNSALFQFGAQVKANAKAVISDKFVYETQLVLFYDYLYDYNNTKNDHNFPVRVNWDNKISWMVAKMFKIGLDTWLIYDPIINFETDPVAGEPGDHRVQFKEFVSINFTYLISNQKK